MSPKTLSKLKNTGGYFLISMERLSFFLILDLFIILGCDNRADRELLQIEEAEYSTEMFTKNFQPFQDKESKQVAFLELNTHHKIQFFEENGTFIKEIVLADELYQNDQKFCDAFVINSDSILLLSMFTNQLYLLNGNGEIIIKKDYSNANQDGVELWGPLNFVDGKVYTTVMYSYPNYSNSYTLADWQSENVINLKYPRILVDSIDSDDPKSYELLIPDFRSKFGDSTHQIIEPNHVCYTSNHIILSSSYSDSVYCYDYSGNAVKSAQLSSNFTSLKIDPSTFKECEVNPQIINEKCLSNGFIAKIIYDPYRNIYYCKARHPAVEDSRPFSLIMLNSDFQKLDEVTFTSDEFFGSFFVGEKGIYILKNAEDKFLNSSFTIYNYE